MNKILHLLRQPPDDTVEKIIDTISGDRPATVVCLYDDDVSHRPVNWTRLVEDIFTHDKVFCW